MMTQSFDPNYLQKKARQIRARIPVILSKWGLLSKFKRWRLTQDPDTGLVVLFAVLNNKYLATHTTIPFGNYFDPRLLHDLANDLHVQVVSCNSDGLRYAFILDSGRIETLPTHIDFPALDDGRQMVRVVYDDDSATGQTDTETVPAPPVTVKIVGDVNFLSQGVESFIKILNDMKQKSKTAAMPIAQGLPDLMLIDKEEFNKKVADYNPDWVKINHIRRMLGGKKDISQKMLDAMLYALNNNGKLYRYRGGFWAKGNWTVGQYPWFGTITIQALVSRGLMSFTGWQKGRNGAYPISVDVSEPSDGEVQLSG